MKILAGRFGGRKIKTSKNLPYRPTKSLVRKSLFDHLTPFEYNSVLDLFADFMEPEYTTIQSEPNYYV